MTRLVDPDQIEAITRRERHATAHYARASAGVVYLLHSRACVAAHEAFGRDLTQCSFSRALDRGVDLRGLPTWNRAERVAIRGGRLVPVPDLDQPTELTLQQVAEHGNVVSALGGRGVRITDSGLILTGEDGSAAMDLTTAGANDRQWRMPARLAEPRPAARRGIPYGADPHGRCPACDRHIRPTGECGCSD